MSVARAIEYATVIPDKYELRTRKTETGILLELPFAPYLPIYITKEEKKVLKRIEIKSEEDLRAFQAINNTIFLIAREYLLPDQVLAVVPDSTILPDYIFAFNDKYISPATEAINIRKIKYSLDRQVREEGLLEIAEAFKYAYFNIFRTLIAKSTYRGLLIYEDVMDEFKSETYDVIFNNFDLSMGTRLSTTLINSIKQRVIRSYGRISHAAYVPEKVRARYYHQQLPIEIMQNIARLLDNFSIDATTEEYEENRIDISSRTNAEDEVIAIHFLEGIEDLITQCALSDPDIKVSTYLLIGRAYYTNPINNGKNIGGILGRRLGISRERVRQIKNKILKYLVKNRDRLFNPEQLEL